MGVFTVGTRLTSEAYMDSQGYSECKLGKDTVIISIHIKLNALVLKK